MNKYYKNIFIVKLLFLLFTFLFLQTDCRSQEDETGKLLFRENFTTDNKNNWSNTRSSSSSPYNAYITEANYYYCELPNNSWGFTWVGIAPKINQLLQSNANVQLSIDFSVSRGNINSYFSFGLMFGLHNVTSECIGGDFYLLQVTGNLTNNQAWGGVAERKNCNWYNKSAGNGQIINLNPLQKNKLVIDKRVNKYTVYLNGTETISFNYDGELGLKLYYEAGEYKFYNVELHELKTNVLTADINNNNNANPNQAALPKPADADFTEVSGNTIMVGKNYALLIGTSIYDDSRFTPLANASSDVDKIYSTLTGLYKYDPRDIFRLQNVTKNQFENTVDNLINTIGENDNLLIFYAGHNSYNASTGKGYWLFKDSNKDRLSSLLSNESLKEYIANIKAKHILLISDACFGVTLRLDLLDNVPKDIKQLYIKKSRTYMSSSSFTPAPDRSIFIEYLIKELRANNKKMIAAGDLFNLFKNNVISNSEVDQIPIYGVMRVTGDEQGDYIFIKK